MHPLFFLFTENGVQTQSLIKGAYLFFNKLFLIVLKPSIRLLFTPLTFERLFFFALARIKWIHSCSLKVLLVYSSLQIITWHGHNKSHNFSFDKSYTIIIFSFFLTDSKFWFKMYIKNTDKIHDFFDSIVPAFWFTKAWR